MLEVFHWLPVRQHIELPPWLGIAPIYLTDLCQVLQVVAPYALREGGPLRPVCFYHSHASPCFCANGLPLELCLLSGSFPTHSIVVLKLLFDRAKVGSASE